MDSRGRGRLVVILVVLAVGGSMGAVACSEDDERSLSPPYTDGGTTLDVDELPTAGSIEGVASLLVAGGIRCDGLREVEVVAKGRGGPLPIEAGECETDGGAFALEVFGSSADVPTPATADCGDESARAMDGDWIGVGNRGADVTVGFAPSSETKQQGAGDLAGLWAIETDSAETVAQATDLAVVWALVDCGD
jgi:hypothetical protein